MLKLATMAMAVLFVGFVPFVGAQEETKKVNALYVGKFVSYAEGVQSISNSKDLLITVVGSDQPTAPVLKGVVYAAEQKLSGYKTGDLVVSKFENGTHIWLGTFKADDTGYYDFVFGIDNLRTATATSAVSSCPGGVCRVGQSSQPAQTASCNSCGVQPQSTGCAQASSTNRRRGNASSGCGGCSGGRRCR